ncbi:MAG: hypothetical protein HY606_15300 [Planctomycetes bacterium]|nr:hypothetical protein [Planctomycetota bacterium]
MNHKSVKTAYSLLAIVILTIICITFLFKSGEKSNKENHPKDEQVNKNATDENLQQIESSHTKTNNGSEIDDATTQNQNETRSVHIKGVMHGSNGSLLNLRYEINQEGFYFVGYHINIWVIKGDSDIVKLSELTKQMAYRGYNPEEITVLTTASTVTSEAGQFAADLQYKIAKGQRDLLILFAEPAGFAGLLSSDGKSSSPFYPQNPIPPCFAETYHTVLDKPEQTVDAVIICSLKMAKLSFQILPEIVNTEGYISSYITSTSAKLAFSVGIVPDKYNNVPSEVGLQLHIERKGYEDHDEFIEPLSPGEEKFITINMTKSFQKFSGKLLDWNNTPVQGIDIWMKQGALNFQATTDGNGNFTFTGIKNVKIDYVTPAIAWKSTMYKPAFYDDINPSTLLTIKLEKAGPIKFTGKCVSKSGSPAVGISVYVDQTDNLLRRISAAAISNEKGEFIIDGMLDKQINSISFNWLGGSNGTMSLDSGKIVLNNVDIHTPLIVTIE